MMARVEQAVEPTAAQRLETARAGLQRLMNEQAEERERKAAAQREIDGLDAQLIDLRRRGDVGGADVAAAVATAEGQRAAALQIVGDATLAANGLAQRIAAVRAELPRFEAAVLQDELAAAVETAAGSALRYRSALEGFLAAAVVLQSDLATCERLSNNLVAKGVGPRTKLHAHLVPGAELDRVLRAAREGGNPAKRATAQLFEHWRL
jgi:hypothetical protein